MEIFIPAKFIYDCSTYRVKDPGRKSVQCALCRNKECLTGKNCSVIKSGLDYNGDNLKSIQVSAWLESDPVKRTKLEEIAIYSKRLGYRKIGIAFCIEHEREARQSMISSQGILRYFRFAARFAVLKKRASISKKPVTQSLRLPVIP